MKQFINYFLSFNRKTFIQTPDTSEVNLKTKSVHYRRDLDSLGEYLKLK